MKEFFMPAMFGIFLGLGAIIYGAAVAGLVLLTTLF